MNTLSFLSRPYPAKVLMGLAAFLLLLVSYPAHVMADYKKPLQPVRYVDSNRYAGRWYEIALIPYFFEKSCAKNSIVEYTRLADGSYKDYFECEKDNGKKRIFEGRAKILDTQSNAIWSSTFLKVFGWRYWFGSNYWIIGLGDNSNFLTRRISMEPYTYTIVGMPSRRYAWIMARKPELSKAELKEAIKTLTDQGFDACKLEMIPHDGTDTKVVSLCQAVL
ncbi:MAG: lipocalin family protein [Cyanobacteria bacterium P01_H01_bin.74]